MDPLKLPPAVSPKTPLPQWNAYCVGAAWGVFYLGEIGQSYQGPVRDAEGQIVGYGPLLKKVVLPSAIYRALPLLRGPDPDWQRLHPGEAGFCTPSLADFAPAPLVALGRKQGRPVEWKFRSCERCIEANREPWRGRWRLVPTEDPEIWAVFAD